MAECMKLALPVVLAVGFFALGAITGWFITSTENRIRQL